MVRSLDYWMSYLNAEKLMPAKYQGKDGVYKLHEDLGVGFYLQGYYPFTTLYDNVKTTEEEKENLRINTYETPYGILREVWEYIPDSYCWAPKEHMVKDCNDLKALRYLFEHTYYEPDYKLANERKDLVGENGIVLCYLAKSPFMYFITHLSGIEEFSYCSIDASEELDETLYVIEKKLDEASELALNSPAECLMIPENISSEVIGKIYYEKYMRGYEEKWTKRVKAAGKYSFVHIDGTLRGLLREISKAGFDVLEALTPAPVGDIEIEDMKNWVDGDSIIWGGIPGVYFTDLISDDEFDNFVIRVLETMKKEPRYVLGVADQVPPKARMERIARVNFLVEEHGTF